MYIGSSVGTVGYGSLILRVAMYLYGKDFNGKGDKVLAGENCDVFQLILEVNSVRSAQDRPSDIAIRPT